LSKIKKLFYSGCHQYSARFQCQLALTDLHGNIEDSDCTQSLYNSEKMFTPIIQRKFMVDVAYDEAMRNNSICGCKSLNSSFSIYQGENNNNEIHDLKYDDENINYELFTECLQIANDSQSILSFQYQNEEKPDVITVSELFEIKDLKSQPNTPLLKRKNITISSPLVNKKLYKMTK